MRCADNDHTCAGEFWQCHFCKEWRCQTHFHITSHGAGVECPACEEKRLDALADSGAEPNLSAIDSMADRLDVKNK